MNFNEYQDKARVYAFPHIENDAFYFLLGLCGETGEVAEKVKKIIRDQGGAIQVKDKQDIAMELGDVLWYLSNLARLYGFTLNEIAELNLKKLEKRKENDKLSGNGDDR